MEYNSRAAWLIAWNYWGVQQIAKERKKEPESLKDYLANYLKPVEEMLAHLRTAPEPQDEIETPKVLIIEEDGCLLDVLTSVPVDVYNVAYDVTHTPMISVPQPNGSVEHYYGEEFGSTVDPVWVAHIAKIIESGERVNKEGNISWQDEDEEGDEREEDDGEDKKDE